MTTLFDYLQWRKDLSFRQDPLNEVDNLILSNLAYIHFDGVLKDFDTTLTLKEVKTAFFNLDPSLQIVRDKRDFTFLEELANSERYKDLKLMFYHKLYDEKSLCQFAALTIEIDKGLYYLAYRGTDLSLIGWKEDITLAFKVVDAQKEALAYLNRVNKKLPFAKYYLGGHSKGGNLAMYAASHCNQKVFKKIKTVFNNDGPGFDESIISKKHFDHLHQKTISYIPHSSIVGLLFENIGTQIIIDSKNISIFQHDPYSWLISGPNLVKVQEIDKRSIYLQKTLNTWLKRLPLQKRESFIVALLEIFDASGAKEVKEILPSIFKNAKAMFKVIDHFDAETKNTIASVFKELYHSLKDK